QFALDLAGTVREAEFGHVTQTRSFPPSGVGNPVPLVQWGSTGKTADVARWVLATTPLTLDPVHSVLRSPVGPQPARLDQVEASKRDVVVVRSSSYVARFAGKVTGGTRGARC